MEHWRVGPGGGAFKKCSACGQVKPEQEFYLHSRGNGYRKSECKECTGKRQHDAYFADLERKRAYRREWQRAHRRPPEVSEEWASEVGEMLLKAWDLVA